MTCRCVSLHPHTRAVAVCGCADGCACPQPMQTPTSQMRISEGEPSRSAQAALVVLCSFCRPLFLIVFRIASEIVRCYGGEDPPSLLPHLLLSTLSPCFPFLFLFVSSLSPCFKSLLRRVLMLTVYCHTPHALVYSLPSLLFLPCLSFGFRFPMSPHAPYPFSLPRSLFLPPQRRQTRQTRLSPPHRPRVTPPLARPLFRGPLLSK